MELGFLEPLFDRAGPWACVYLDTSRATEDAPRRLRLRQRYVADRLAGQGADEDTREAVTEALGDWRAAPSSAGRALFATGGSVVLDCPLALAPPDVVTSWSTLPRIAPLAELRGEYPVCLVAYIDRTGADLELLDTYGRQPAGQVQGRQWRGRGHRSIPADRYEWHYRHRVENSWDQAAAAIAGELGRQCLRSGAGLVVLAGDPQERRAVLDRLPEPVREVSQEARHGSRAAGSSCVALEDEIARARAEHARAHLETVLDHFRAGRGRPGGHGPPDTGGAAEGAPAVVDAVRNHRAATLLLGQTGPDPHRAVWVGPGVDQIAVRRGQAQQLGVSSPEPAPADDALMRSAVAARTEVLLVPPDLRGPAGGLGAVLRWGD